MRSQCRLCRLLVATQARGRGRSGLGASRRPLQLTRGQVEPLQDLFGRVGGVFPDVPPLVPQSAPPLVLGQTVEAPGRPLAEPAVHDSEVHVGLQEVGHRVPLVGAHVHHPVDGGLEAPGGPPRQHVAQVHHEGVFDRTGVDPVAVLGVEHLQPAYRVLLQDREQPVVCVLPDADLRLEVLDWPVVQQAVRGHRLCENPLEEVPRLIQDQGHDREELLGQLEHLG
mmetsp:Transcript_50249/g.132827  ORF Transcript_50249/g.132827 Transcript_50249/m.132827 type:complete len:225 (-) Transcript_50249:1784-2458(-)